MRKRRASSKLHEIDPDEILLDSSNLPRLDEYQFEGRLEQPIARRSLVTAGLVFIAIGTVLAARAWILQVQQGHAYSVLAEHNTLKDSVIIASRGLIRDRNGVVLASNVANAAHPEFASRAYLDQAGLSHLLGYVEYPKTDSSGQYYRSDYSGKEGVEAIYNDILRGENGMKITEENAVGTIESESVLQPPRDGSDVTLSVDSRLNTALYGFMKNLAAQRHFTGGAAVIMDIHSGEMIAITSFPEFNSSIMSEGTDTAAIEGYLSDPRQPFLDRAVAGLYTPGSIVKPFLAVGALQEGVISPDKKILSTGSISVPNPYDPSKPTIFRDWQPQGWVDMRQAIAVSSDVYFYEVGGGYQNQPGLGIANIKKYMQRFGFGTTTPGNPLLDAAAGTIPDPAWKALNFNGQPWRIGDTYNTAIGQYGMQVTPMQVVRAVAAIANGGYLINPTLLLGGNAGQTDARNLGFSNANLKVVQEGMRDSVLFGTSKNLNVPQVAIAAKTGTAQIGAQNQRENSWVEGFYPYDNPQYAFAAIMENGPATNDVGALYVMRQFFDWLPANAPEYLK